MSKSEQKNRILLLSGEIMGSMISPVVSEILKISEDDEEKEDELRDWVKEPIKLFINSSGGSIYDGLALVDVIKRSKTPVHTICIGSCMSMGMWIWLAGAERIIGETATLMFHDVATSAWGKTELCKQELKEGIRLQEILVKEIINKSLIKEETLKDFITRKAEWYITPSEAIELKLADEYYK